MEIFLSSKIKADIGFNFSEQKKDQIMYQNIFDKQFDSDFRI